MEIEIKVTAAGTEIRADGEQQSVLELIDRVARIAPPEATDVAIEKIKQETRQVESSNGVRVKVQASTDRLRSIVAFLTCVTAIVLVFQSCDVVRKNNDKNTVGNDDRVSVSGVWHPTGLDAAIGC